MPATTPCTCPACGHRFAAPLPQLYTTADLCALLRVKERFIYGEIEKQKLVPIRLGGARVGLRFEPEEVARYLQACRMQGMTL